MQISTDSQSLNGFLLCSAVTRYLQPKMPDVLNRKFKTIRRLRPLAEIHQNNTRRKIAAPNSVLFQIKFLFILFYDTV